MDKNSALFTLILLTLFALASVRPAQAQNPVPVPVPVMAQAQDAALSTAEHTFVFVAGKTLKSVHVAGTFNDWNRTASLLAPDPDGKTWRTTLRVPLGKSLYKFVLNSETPGGETWVVDPAARSEDDGTGNRNSVLLLLPPDYTIPARPGDGIIARSALQHSASLPYVNYDRGQLAVSLRARPGDLRAVWLRIGSRRLAMTATDPATASDLLYTRYTAQLPWDRKRTITYDFVLDDGQARREFGADGLHSSGKATPFRLNARTFRPFTVPGWVERTVFYQIFPDRFANGDTTNDPPNREKWDAAPTFGNRFGGDVAGVRAHLPYLAGLGISAVYFNPVFQSPSNHRYDTEDFRTVDPAFGTTAGFSSLTRALQGKGIRTVMDFVFNHTAPSFAPFADIRKNGAESAYRDWYFIKSYPVRVEENPNYVAWFNYPGMPKLNLSHPATHDYMLNLVDYWKREVPLAGLRLDVANEVDPRFWRDLRRRAKSLDPEMWIVGEVWGDGSPWLAGDQWDSKMNYEFLWPNRDFIAGGKITPTVYMTRLMTLYRHYPPQVSRSMMNLLSSHDTPRFLTVCGGDAALDRLAATVQFTWVGAPSIYYGEELGMQGGADPANRRGMEWDRATPANPMLRYYRRLIALRNTHPALQSGDPRVLMTDDTARTLAYARVLGSETVIIALNRSDKPQKLVIPLPGKAGGFRGGFVDGLTGQRVKPSTKNTLTVTLPPLRAAIYVPSARPSKRAA